MGTAPAAPPGGAPDNTHEWAMTERSFARLRDIRRDIRRDTFAGIFAEIARHRAVTELMHALNHHLGV